MNYFAVHAQSNIIFNVISSGYVPHNSENITFYPASDGRLNQYYERKKWDTPIDIYSIIPKPKIPNILPLTEEVRVELVEYVSKRRHRETVERMAFVWRVSERTIRDILDELTRATGTTTPLPLATLQHGGVVAV